MPVSSAIASWSPRALRVATASSFSTSVASDLNSRIAARASPSAALTDLLVSLASAASTGSSAVSSCDLKTDCAAWRRVPTSGDWSVDAAAQAVVEAHRAGAIGNAGDGLAGRSIDRLAVGTGDVNLLAIRVGHEATVLERADDGESQLVAAARDDAYRLIGVGEIVIGEFGDRILERTGKGRQCERDQKQR